MTLARRSSGVLAALAVAILFVGGCLFPSFEQFIGPGPDSGRRGGDDDDDPPTTPDAASGTSSSSSSGSSSGQDAPPDAPVLPREVVCGGTTCPVDREFCCLGIAPPVCIDNDSSEQCIVATFLHCDGKEDCPGDQVCCSINGSDDVTCQATCPGTVLCNGNGICPDPKRCTGTIGGGYQACQ